MLLPDWRSLAAEKRGLLHKDARREHARHTHLDTHEMAGLMTVTTRAKSLGGLNGERDETLLPRSSSIATPPPLFLTPELLRPLLSEEDRSPARWTQRREASGSGGAPERRRDLPTRLAQEGQHAFLGGLLCVSAPPALFHSVVRDLSASSPPPAPSDPPSLSLSRASSQMDPSQLHSRRSLWPRPGGGQLQLVHQIQRVHCREPREVPHRPRPRGPLLDLPHHLAPRPLHRLDLGQDRNRGKEGGILRRGPPKGSEEPHEVIRSRKGPDGGDRQGKRYRFVTNVPT